MLKYILPLFLSIIFFIASLITLQDYGISWDEATHFKRGQAYLDFFLTGNLHYQTPPRSYFQNTTHDAYFWLTLPQLGHPPLNGILAASFNRIFYQELGILSDLDAYHLFNIMTASILVFIVIVFAVETIGLVPAIFTFLTITTYPLFWSESHFNIKDPVLAALFTGSIWAFYKSLSKGSVAFLLTSIAFFAVGVSTKLNMIFLPLIIFLYLLRRYSKHMRHPVVSLRLIPKIYLLLILLSPLVVVVVFISSWPTLWYNWPDNLFKVFEYYRLIGTGTNYQPESFYIFGINTFAIQWIIFTTPPIVLILVVIGIFNAAKYHQKNSFAPLLWLLWLLIPIIRVSMPGMSVYGGVRQIMEFLPAMALLTGLGVYTLLQINKYKLVILMAISVAFVIHLGVLIKLHPNENVYFNSLIGGLNGAREKNFPSWGNSYGNAYLQGVNWINSHLPNGSKLTLLQGELQNVFPPKLRQDIDFKKEHFSGSNRQGEYIMELNLNDTANAFAYRWEYVNKFLTPVHQIIVEGVPILTIWQNSNEYVIHGTPIPSTQYKNTVTVNRQDNILSIDLPESILLDKLFFNFISHTVCEPQGIVETSLDKQTWVKEKDPLPTIQVGDRFNVADNKAEVYFAATKAKYIRIMLTNSPQCILNITKTELYSYTDL